MSGSCTANPAYGRAAHGQAATEGVHAVTELGDEGARTAICGLKGRFLTDKPLTAGVAKFKDVSVLKRCTGCHLAWLNSIDGGK